MCDCNACQKGGDEVNFSAKLKGWRKLLFSLAIVFYLSVIAYIIVKVF